MFCQKCGTQVLNVKLSDVYIVTISDARYSKNSPSIQAKFSRLFKLNKEKELHAQVALDNLI